MANVRLKNIQFPGLDNTYTIPDEAPAYSTSGTYAVGDMVIYDGKLYKCTTAITTAEAWTAAHWSETKMGNEVSALKTAVTQDIPIEINNLRTAYGLNRLNQALITGGNIEYKNGEFVGIARAFSERTSQDTIPLDNMRTDRRYTLSFKAYTEGNASTSGNGLQVGFKYSDGTNGKVACPNSTTTYTEFSFISTSILPKQIVSLYFSYGSAATNVWHIKDLIVVEGTVASPYVPYFTAYDKTARESVLNYVKNSFFSKPFMSNGREKFAMHRGFRSETIPWENSMPAFVNAGENHAFACETDVRTTSDGHFICMHDSTVDRTTNGTGNVSEMTLAQLSALKLKNPDTGDVSDNSIPTFTQYLRVCKMYSMVAIAELKSVSRENMPNILSIIEKEGMTDRCILTIPTNLLNFFRTINTTIPIMSNWDSTHDEYTSIIDTFKPLENSGICYEQSQLLTQEVIDECHNNGIFVVVWTVDFLSTAKTYAGYSADIIITNNFTSYE